MDRRGFLGWLAASGALAKSAIAKAETAPPAPRSGYSILQGMTDETSAQFTLLLPKDETFEIRAERPGGQALALTSSVVVREFSDHAIQKIFVDGLTVGEVCRLRVLDGAGNVKDDREFSALDLAPRKVKIGLLSCAMDHLHREDIWRQFYRQKPEIAFFLGDNVYCDRKTLGQLVEKPDPRLIWERYVATRLKVAFYFQKRLTPVLAIWDDHDFGGNNSMGDFAFKDETRGIFETFFAQEARPALAQGPGIARQLSAFGADFFLLDGRSFRDTAAMLGTDQQAWLGRRLKPGPAWLLNGSMFFGAYGQFESYEGNHGVEFVQVLKLVRDRGTVAAFVSGDVHFSEVMKIEPAVLGYESFELVSSSIHSFTFPAHHQRFHNPRRVAADSSHNFLIFEGRFGAGDMGGKVTCWTAGYDPFDAMVWAGR